MDQEQSHDEVLIATDGSLSSQIAATLASQLAEIQQLKVKGLYVVNEHYVVNNYSDYQPELGPIDPQPSRAELIDLFKTKGEMAMEWLETLCHRMNIPFEYEIVFGFVPDEIARHAREAKLVAFGKKGFHQPEDCSHLGENYHQFIHKIHPPFIAGDNELRPVRNILLGYNGSAPADRALEWAQFIGNAFHAKTYVVYVMENGTTRDNADHFEESLQKSRLENYEWTVLEGDPIDQFSRVALQKDIDLLVVGCCHHASMIDWLKGSTLDRLLQKVRLTTLVG